MTINRTNPSTPSSATTTFSHPSLLASSPIPTTTELTPSQPPLPPSSRPPSSARATSTTLHPDSQSSSSFRPNLSRMRSRGRSITATDPSLLLSTPLPLHPSFSPAQSSGSTTHHQSPSQRASPLPSPSLNPSVYTRSRAPTLSVLPSSVRQFESIEDEPDTPDRPRDSDTWFVPNNSNHPTHGRGRSLSLGVQPLKNMSNSKRQSLANGPKSTTASTTHKHKPSKRSKPWGGSLFGFSNASVGNLGIGTNSRDQLWQYPEEPDGEHSPIDKPEAYHDQTGSDSSEIDSDEEDMSGSQDGSEASLRIRVQQHGSNLHLPLLPFNPLPRRPTLTFTSPSSTTTLPLSPSETDQNPSSSQQTSYFYNDQTAFPPTLPTPALSSSSLSTYNFRPAYNRSSTDLVRNGDSLNEVTTTVSSARRVTARELRQLAKGMIPTLIGIAIAFLCSFGVVIGLLRGLPIPGSLKGGIPKSSADIQLVSSAINRYMENSTSGYIHTMFALGLAGVWTHAWSVPGSVVLNVLLGALLPAIPAVFFLTCSTTLGGFCSYLLSRPLSPLITLLFPTQLAVVRASIASPGLSTSAGGSKQTGFGSGPWRKLFVMRATGLVPWSGMNVACGVVGVRWDVFCGTFAAGSLSWNYVTSQVGALLMQISQPTGSPADPQDPAPSESISSLLRDPSIIIKLVALSLLSLIPVLLKPKTTVTVQDGRGPPIETSASAGWWALPLLTRMGHGRGPAGVLGTLQRFIGFLGAKASRWVGVDWMRGMEEGVNNTNYVREGLMSGIH